MEHGFPLPSFLLVTAYPSTRTYEWPMQASDIRDQENRIRVAIDDLVEFLNVMGAD